MTGHDAGAGKAHWDDHFPQHLKLACARRKSKMEVDKKLAEMSPDGLQKQVQPPQPEMVMSSS